MKTKLIILVVVILSVLLSFYFISCLNFSQPKTKVILIGSDAMERGIIDTLVNEGKLPNFEKFKDYGSYGYLTSPYSFSPVSWTEIATGKTRTKHGIYDFFVDDGERTTNSMDIQSKRVWDIISENGRTVGVYNWLLTWPVEEVNGFMISNWFSKTNDSFYPPEVGIDLKQQKLNSGTNRIEETSAEMLYLIEKYRPDFFAGSEFFIHGIEHFYWKYWKPEEFNITDKAEIENNRNVIIKAYQSFDTFLQNLDTIAGENSVIFVVSDHGMKSQIPVEYHIEFYDILESLGLYSYSQETMEMLPDSELSQVTINIEYPYFIRFLFLHEEVNKTEILGKLSNLRYDEINKTFFSYFELEGNSVIFKIDYASFISNMKEDVSSEEAIQYFGHPNLYVPLLLPTGERIKLYFYEKSGEHPPGTNGIIIVKGPMIKKNYEIKNATVYDVTPTILYLHGIPIPKDIDGRVLTEIIEDNYLNTHPIRYTDKSSQKETSKATTSLLNKATEEDVIKKLQELGYIQ